MNDITWNQIYYAYINALFTSIINQQIILYILHIDTAVVHSVTGNYLILNKTYIS